MRGEVADTERAARRIAAILVKRFPKARACLFITPGGSNGVRQIEGPLEEILPVMGKFLGQLGRAWINLNPDHPYGMVCRALGHCKCPFEGCQHGCTKYYERPRALLTLLRTQQEDVRIGGHIAPGRYP
jgi:hypothetical protein